MTTAEEDLYRDIWKQKLQREAADITADGNIRGSAAIDLIDKGDRFLDIGCGEGTFAGRVRDRFSEVYGLDISQEAVKLAVRNGIRASRVNLNLEPIPFPEGYFDTVSTLDVIEHIFDPVRFLREIHRVLRPGGAVVISTPNIRKIQRILALIRGRFPRMSYDPVGFDGGHLHYFTSMDMRMLLEEAGFTVILVDGICTDRRSWKYVVVTGLLGKRFEKEFLSSAVLLKAIKC